MTETITPERLKKIREQWDMTQAQFAELLSVSKDTYRRWEMTGASAVQMPAPVAAHVATIGKLKKIYGHWDRKIGTPLAGTEEFDGVIDDHEALWAKLFPVLSRE